MLNRNLPYSLAAALLLSLLVIYSTLSKPPRNLLSWDVYGYYLYLPQAFIQDDLSILHRDSTVALMKKYKSSDTFYQAQKLENGNHLIKYTMGMAVTYAPFFVAGHVWAKASGAPADGFSPPYQKAVYWGCIFYTIFGLWLFRAVLRRFFSEGISAVVLALIVLGTNYQFHTMHTGQNAMTHNALFMLYALILLQTVRWHETLRWRDIVLLGLACGLAILTRPTELVCLLLPLLWGVDGMAGARAKLLMLYRKLPQVLTFTLLVVAVVLPQLLYWKAMSGSFFTNSYGGNAGEGLDFDQPYFFKVLFSYRKGWLLYTPLMVLAIAGLVMTFRLRRDIFFAVMAYFLLNLYFVASWSCWWYGPSFSQRALIPSYPIMALGLGTLLAWAWKRPLAYKIGFGVLLGLLLSFTQIQHLQYRREIIDKDRMTGEYYWRSFLKLKRDLSLEKYLLVRRESFSNDTIRFPELYGQRPFRVMDAEGGSPHADSSHAHEGHFSIHIDSKSPYSEGVNAKYSEITDRDHAWLRISGWVFPKDSLAVNGLKLVCEFDYNDKAYAYSVRPMNPQVVKPGEWCHVSFNYLTPEVRYSSDNLKTFFWLTTPSEAWVDEFTVDVLERK